MSTPKPPVDIDTIKGFIIGSLGMTNVECSFYFDTLVRNFAGLRISDLRADRKALLRATVPSGPSAVVPGFVDELDVDAALAVAMGYEPPTPVVPMVNASTPITESSTSTEPEPTVNTGTTEPVLTVTAEVEPTAAELEAAVEAFLGSPSAVPSTSTSSDPTADDLERLLAGST